MATVISEYAKLYGSNLKLGEKKAGNCRLFTNLIQKIKVL